MNQKCSTCHAEKPASEKYFAWRRDAQCLRRQCRDCMTAKRKEPKPDDPEGHRRRRRERLRARRQRKRKPEINRRAHAKWCDKNRERKNEYMRAYKAMTNDRHTKQWRAKNRERYNQYMADWRRRNKIKSGDGTDLLSEVLWLIPSHITGEVREDIAQELVLRVLSGETQLSEIRTSIKPLLTKFFRDYADRRLLSLDAPVQGFDNLTFGETIAG